MSGSREDAGPAKSIRRLTEIAVGDRARADIETLTMDEIHRLVHELEVHQVELEVQNKQLAEAQLAAEEASEGYRRLYESTPIGQLTINLEGEVTASNLRVAGMLGIPGSLVGQNLSKFVIEAHQDRWYFARRALEKGDRLAFELSLARADGTILEGQFTGWRHPSGGSSTFELALLDVTELRSKERALRRAASQASLAEQRERRKLASDLHDDAGQLLSLASLKLAELVDSLDGRPKAKLREVAGLVADARKRISSLSFELSPPLLHDVGLVAAVQWLADHMGPLYGVAVTVEKTPERDLDEATRVTLYRAIRELLINVAKHAGVDRARVEIWGDDRMVRVAVEDCGVGFSSESSPKGFGLLALRERIAQLGGFVDVGPGAEGLGTRVVVGLPLASREAKPS